MKRTMGFTQNNREATMVENARRLHQRPRTGSSWRETGFIVPLGLGGNTSNGSKIDDRLLRLRHGAGGGDKACCGRSRREPTCRHVSRSSILVYILMCTIFPGLRCCSCFDHEGAKARTCSRRDSERTESSVEKACTAKRVSANFST